MSDRQVTAEAVRRSRAHQEAAERAEQAQERARLARIQAAEQGLHRVVQTLGLVMTACWLLGLGLLIVMEVWF